MSLTEEELARERKFIRGERARIYERKPRFERTAAERAELEAKQLPGMASFKVGTPTGTRIVEITEQLPEGEYVPIKERYEPAGDWKTTVIGDDTVCIERPVNLVRVDAITKEERIVDFDIERNCVSLPATRRCIEMIGESKAREGEFFAGKECDLVKMAFACAEETAGHLTKKQAAAITKIDEYSAETCIDKLKKDKLLESPTGGRATKWAGDFYYVMTEKNRQKIKDELTH